MSALLSVAGLRACAEAGRQAPTSIAVASIADVKIVDGRSTDIRSFPRKKTLTVYIGCLRGDAMASVDRNGIGLSTAEGRFAAAENLSGNPASHLTEAVDSPLYRIDAGFELNGVDMSVSYDGAFGETVEQSAISASLKVSF